MSEGYETADLISAREKAILVGAEFPAELQQLAKTAGAATVGVILQKRNWPDPKYFIGRGKVDELKMEVAARGANLVIFDNELSPAQNRNLETQLGVKVIDRTELILDIFAGHAMSREGKV
ncbi:MAG: GTPase HflX, partial [Candidatus Margulisiibacteriota bacterium]